jgi:RDD family protein
VVRSAVAEHPHPLWPATDAAWRDAAWRKEIASRVRAHKKRRGHEVEDSLPLAFEETASLMESDQQLLAALEQAAQEEAPAPPPPSRYQRIAMKRAQAQYEAGNLIVFPPPSSRDLVEEALAEPIPETPRILEAPAFSHAGEQAPLFSGIELDALPQPAYDIAPELESELPLPVAPLPQQLVCLAADSALALCGFGLFAWIVMTQTDLSLTERGVWACGVAVGGLFWTAYHFAFLYWSSATPGMLVSGAGLCTFEDTLPCRATRMKRAAALVLSMMSLGMGFGWACVDEDNLGWHDRISRTYLRLL